MKNFVFFLVTSFIPQLVLAADAPAILQWSHRVELSAPVSGVVKSVDVQIGERLKKGQVLLTLDGAIYQAKVAESQAIISRLSAEAAEAKRDLDRVQELYARTVVATAELDLAKLRQTRAESLLAEARANLRQNQKVLEDTSMRAPYDAVVIERQVEPGMSVAAGLQPQVLLVLARSGEMLARLHLPSAQIEKLKVGQAVSLSAGGKNYQGTIAVLGLEPAKLAGEAAYQVDVSFSSNEQLRAGTVAVVKLP